MPSACIRIPGMIALLALLGSCATLEDKTLFDSGSGPGVSVYFYQTVVLGVCCGMMGQAHNVNPVPVCIQMNFGGTRRVALVPAGATVEVHRTGITGWSGAPRWSMWDPRTRPCKV